MALADFQNATLCRNEWTSEPVLRRLRPFELIEIAMNPFFAVQAVIGLFFATTKCDILLVQEILNPF